MESKMATEMEMEITRRMEMDMAMNNEWQNNSENGD
jgi:hypothetical protein